MYFYCDFSQKKSKYQTLCLTDTTIHQNSYTVDKLCHRDEGMRLRDKGMRLRDEGTGLRDEGTRLRELKKSSVCRNECSV